MKLLKTLLLLLILALCTPAALACADDVIVLPDPVLEDAVRGEIGKKEGDITIADVENVVALDLGYFEGEQIKDLHGLEWFPALDGVCFNRQAVGDLSPLAMIESLDFIEIGDAGLEDLSSLRSSGVTQLLLYGNQISDLSPLKDMTQLELLVLEGNQITDVSPLAGLVNLRVLILGDNPIWDYTPLAGIYDQLEEKDFELTAPPVVHFADSILEDAIRGMIGKKDGEITAADVAGLTMLDFGAPGEERISDLGGLEHFSSLEEIHLPASSVTDLSPLAGLGNLRTIEISDARIDSVEPLRGMNLTEVLLSGNQIEDVSPFEDMHGLNTLVLAGNRITDVQPLAGLVGLRALNICDNLIGDFTPLADIYDQLEEKDFELTKAEAIAFADPVLERKIREMLGRPEGEITTEDALMIDELYLNSEGGDRIADLTGLEYFTNLSNLQANDNDIADITALSGMTLLWNLELGGNRISDLSPLAGLHIENLSLWENQIEDLSPLQDMQSLAILDLCNNRVSDISALAGKTSLWILSLGGNPIADFSPVAELYDGIEEKDFELDVRTRLVLEGKDPDAIVTFDDPVLEGMIRGVIDIPDGDITAADAAGVTELNLELNGGDWSIPRITSLHGLQYFENLRSLDLGWALNPGTEHVDLAPISKLDKLERLTLQGNHIHDISQLSGLTNMMELWLWNNTISDISALAGMTRMESLWLFDNQIGDIGVLANMPELYRVKLANNQVMDISPLAGLEKLVSLEIHGNPVWGYQALAGIYPQLNERDFDIADEPAADRPEDPDAVVIFADPLLERKLREQMNLPQGDITALDAAMVTSLHFDVDWNEDLTESDFIVSLEGLEFFINLRDLSMYQNGITDLTPIAGLTRLETLDFASNRVEDLSPLQNLTHLQSLTFFNNNVEDISVLANFTELKSLWMKNNPIADYTPIQELYGTYESTDFEYGEHFERMYKPDNMGDVVIFTDTTLERKVREHIGKPEGDIYVEDIAFHDVLQLGNYENLPPGEKIHDLTGLENCLNLKELDLQGQAVSDISALAAMWKLTTLNIANNNVSDLSPLAGLEKLRRLWISGNPFTDFTPLAEMYDNLTEKDFEYGKPPLPENAYEVIAFPDPVLDAAVRECLQVYGEDIVVKQVFNHNTLNIGNYTDAPEVEQIHDLTGLENFAGLKHLDISGQAVSDLSPLAGLTELETLIIADNAISDLTPLAGMTKLTLLWLTGNPIDDVSPIAELIPNLQDKDF